jgi:CRISPR-associated exonuclease Cas4
MSFDDEELVPLSALQHWVYCPRQCALIHVEQCWSENVYTAEGRNLHERVHEAESESRGDVISIRGLRLMSRQFGLVGQADIVEFHRSEAQGCALPGREGHWQPFPVEYKRGKVKLDLCDDIQLCGQAVCLEEMLGVPVPAAALFYGRPRKRKQVELTESLRAKMREALDGVRNLFETNHVPKVKYNSKKCDSCSLLKVCMPKVTCIGKDIEHYLDKALAAPSGDE